MYLLGKVYLSADILFDLLNARVGIRKTFEQR